MADYMYMTESYLAKERKNSHKRSTESSGYSLMAGYLFNIYLSRWESFHIIS